MAVAPDSSRTKRVKRLFMITSVVDTLGRPALAV